MTSQRSFWTKSELHVTLRPSAASSALLTGSRATLQSFLSIILASFGLDSGMFLNSHKSKTVKAHIASIFLACGLWVSLGVSVKVRMCACVCTCVPQAAVGWASCWKSKSSRAKASFPCSQRLSSAERSTLSALGKK